MSRPFNKYGQRPFVHNAKVVWIYGNVIQTILYDKPYAICRQFVKDNKHNPQFTGGVLKAVSILSKEFKGV